MSHTLLFLQRLTCSDQELCAHNLPHVMNSVEAWKILKESVCRPEMSGYVWHFSLKIVKAMKGGKETGRGRGGETKTGFSGRMLRDVKETREKLNSAWSIGTRKHMRL